MKRYPEYKDSGVGWIGKIPVEWDIMKLKYLIDGKLTYGANEVAEETNYENPRYIRITDFDNEGKLRDETFKSLPFDLAKDFLLKEGDVLFARSGATVGKTFQFKKYNGIACFAGYLIKASPQNTKLDSDFLYFFTKSGIYENWKDSIFIQATIQNIGADKYSYLPVPHPPLPHQKLISLFLEHKTSQIDDLIAKKQKLIELLKEERTALINQTITKGLDPTVPMKESGIEWLGEIPEHWEVSKIKYCAEINNDVLGDDTPDDFEFKYVDIGIVTFGKLNGLPEKLLFKNAPSRARRILHEGDTIISTVRTYLKAILFIDNSLNEFVGSTGFAVITPTRRFIPKYLFYIMTSQKIIEQICAISVGVSYPATNASDIGNISIWLPPIKEQDKIVNFIEERMNYLTNIEERSMKEIELISEYKTSLINEVITGKIQVSDAD
jgi:type I restriction enzyme, S subunit